MMSLYSIAVTVHVLAAITWVGGVLFMGMVALPSARRFDEATHRQVTSVVGLRFRAVGWSCLALLVLTGAYMAHAWGATWTNVFNLTFFDSTHTRLLGYKLLAVAVMLVVSGVHDWYIGPRATRAQPHTAQAERLRRAAKWLGMVTGLLVLVIAVLAVFVARPGLA